MNGDLSDFSFPLLLSVLARHTGVLSVQVGPEVALTLHQGHVRHVHVNGVPVRSMSRVQGLVRDLVATSGGAFEFRGLHELAGEGLDVPVTSLLLAVMAEQDVLDQLAAKLPGREERYVLTDQPVVLDNALDAFSGRAYEWLERGCSAWVLARQLDLDVKDVQLNMLRLLEVGLLAPVAQGGETLESPSAAPDPFQGVNKNHP